MRESICEWRRSERHHFVVGTGPKNARDGLEDAMDRLPFPGGQTSGSGVGHFRVSIHVGRRGEGGERFVPLEALVDTGSMYTWVPRDVLQRLGVTAQEQWPFELANGREVRYPSAGTPEARVGRRGSFARARPRARSG